jgi:hypothetical protein
MNLMKDNTIQRERLESAKFRQTMRASFKNIPNVGLKSDTFDAPHLEKFIVRPKTASSKPQYNRYQGINKIQTWSKIKPNLLIDQDNANNDFNKFEREKANTGDNSKIAANEPDKYRNPVDYMHTKYDKFAKPFETFKDSDNLDVSPTNVSFV